MGFSGGSSGGGGLTTAAASGAPTVQGFANVNTVWQNTTGKWLFCQAALGGTTEEISVSPDNVNYVAVFEHGQTQTILLPPNWYLKKTAGSNGTTDNVSYWAVMQ